MLSLSSDDMIMFPENSRELNYFSQEKSEFC